MREIDGLLYLPALRLLRRWRMKFITLFIMQLLQCAKILLLQGATLQREALGFRAFLMQDTSETFGMHLT